MSVAIKMEGFHPSSNPNNNNNNSAGNNASPRPSLGSRPFSDGSMTVDSSILSSLMNPNQPFSFGGSSLPNQSPFDYGMVSPQSHTTDLPSPHSFQPHSMFGHLNFGSTENREPPVSLENEQQGGGGGGGGRSQSSSRASNIGKAPSTKSRNTRKLSMSDVRPASMSTGGRPGARGGPGGPGGGMHPPRSMSFQQDIKPNMNSLIAQRGNSLSATAEFGFDGQYGITIPRNSDYDRNLWEPGSAPGVLPNSMATFGASVGDNPLESPVTPAQNIQHLLGDEGRKQRRRECHNQVEKRRREHINAMIEELNKLLPQKFKMPTDPEVIEDDEDDDAMSVVGTGAAANPSESPVKKRKSKRAASTSKAQKDAAQCKGRILSDSVQYIRDLQSVNEQQSSRIRYLESLLMSSGPSSAPSIPSWPGENAASDNTSSNSNTNSNGHYPPELEAMRTSAEPEHHAVPPLGGDWNSNMLVFETSPTEASSGPDMQRSTPLSSGSPGTDSKDAVVWGLMELTGAAHNEPAHRRKDSAAELQNGMSNMELEVGMDARRPWF